MKHTLAKHMPASALGSGPAAFSFPSHLAQAEQPFWRKVGFFRALQTCLLIGATFLTGTTSAMAQGPQNADAGSAQLDNSSNWDAYVTAVNYVVHFYPLWFTYQQWLVNNDLGATNRMVAPARVSPAFKFVVASNYDTLYASAFLDLTSQPVVVTVPPTEVSYSILVLDFYGNEIPTAIPPIPPQTVRSYAFTGPGFSGTLPDDVTQVPMPVNFPLVNFRAVKFSTTGEDQNNEAAAFIAALKTQPLSGFMNDPSDGPTIIAPEENFTTSFKVTADRLIAGKPIAFLKQLQIAVKSPQTPLLSVDDQKLSDHFDELFGDGDNGRIGLSQGTQKALALIIQNYLTNTGQTRWIHFRNIANWDDNFLDRASISEYLQQSNGINTAAYYHTFSSGDGRPLDGSDPDGYILTFPAGKLPDAKRFWSVTAYTPDAIELVPNCEGKYLVASYTPKLTYNFDGSLTIYMSARQPANAPYANWLPVPKGKFNIVLRVYGPAGDVANNTYVPPAIQRR